MADLTGMKRFALAALMLCSACGSDDGHAPAADMIDDGPSSGGESSGAGGESSTGTGGAMASVASGGAAIGSGGAASGGVATATGGAAGAPGSWCGTNGECETGSTCYAGRCTSGCATDADCETGERCGEMYKAGKLSETANRPPLGCLIPCHIPTTPNDETGCGTGEQAHCEFFIGSRIVGADEGNWLPMPDPCVGGAHFCAGGVARVEGVPLCTSHKP